MLDGQRGLSPVAADHPSLRLVVAGEIRKAILSGRLRPGDKLTEEQLAQELGVSRSPVREALRLLESDGFVELQPRRGAFVARLTAQEAAELFEVREAIEVLIAKLAARRQNPAAIAQMEMILEKRRPAIRRKDKETLTELNTQFHQLLAIAGENETAERLLVWLRNKSERMYASYVLERSHNSWLEHQALLDAVKAGDEELAMELASEHVANARAAYLEEVRQQAL
jgi:DNA-binding GntR family transcriptional regulator